MAADATVILDYVRTLPFVDKDRIGLYGVSLGGDVVLVEHRPRQIDE